MVLLALETLHFGDVDFMNSRFQTVLNILVQVHLTVAHILLKLQFLIALLKLEIVRFPLLIVILQLKDMKGHMQNLMLKSIAIRLNLFQWV